MKTVQAAMTRLPLNGRRKPRVACYLKLREHREALGWSIPELISKLEGTVISERSIRRLEDGLGIRPESAHKIFNAVSKSYHESLSREENIKIVVSE